MESSSTTTAATPPVKTVGKRPRRALAAAPLRDLTNFLPSSPTTPAPRSPSARRALPAHDASACSSAASAASATPPVSKPSAAVVVEEQVEQPSSVKSPISTVYTSRKSQRRTATTRRNPTGVKAPFSAGASASCPPPGKAARAGTSRKASAAQGSHPISSSAPCLQAKTRHMRMKENSSSARPKLPDDFIEKQRAYFREIDAFELPEEEASETD
ncbi:Holliday junction resolvase MOC1, chloroplastic isoform X2 [Brachypodium distachyon]|uniref:Sororin C-terminal region domain-containing protein n=1 Tax=Brachypodium distachyon TaxID=15368 RepID=A0A0Q3ITG7_BRADI|nr:Holliday junction resolvase MOC1, chloroplastic isoform X2 [Brachypodium distachyon]KQJ89416.1 hypothetical protein BRADI_4g25520v3 [Brachypodium distachyon]|eukprot:XP_014757503.1 Holliday junction resolvase MOC1, chloroplastic isoform X2 [Brachypodium distachyon]